MRSSALKKFIALSMCAVMVFSFAACNIAGQIRHQVHDSMTEQRDLSIQELTRLLISAINDKRNTADAYSQIPQTQTDGLSYSYFYEYMNIMRSVSSHNGNGKTVSFRIMSDDECLSFLGQSIFDRYGHIRGAELLSSSESQYPLYLFFSEDDTGRVTLSQEWITSIISIYNYSTHYFTLLDNYNADAVKALLMPGLIGDEYTDDVVYAKAQQLCEFYRLRVMSAISEYEITRLLPDHMSVRIPETLAPDGALFEEHLVDFTRQSTGNYLINDSISATNDINLVYLVRGDERLIRVGNEYSYSQLNTVMGCTPSTFTYDEDAGMIIAIYPGVLLRFDEVSATADDWEGTLTSIRLISSSIYSIGYNLYPGMTRTQVLMAYPFADESDYLITINTGSRDYTVELMFDEEGIVQAVKVSG